MKILLFSSVSLFCIFNLLLAEEVHHSYSDSQRLDVIYWEIKPYIFKNELGEMDGIIPRIFQLAHHLCRKVVNGTEHLHGFAKYVHRADSRHEFRDLLHFGEYKSSSLKNVTESNAFWVPVFSYIDAQRETCLLYTSPSPRDKRQSRMPSSA